ncbi:MAG: UDP-N-acetylmuramate--L-alanine ligase [Candidatus Cryptobacteroides sp.]
MNQVYFIGIGGIGMSAIARYYKFKGLEVSGYDRTPSELTHELEKEGIAVHYEDRPDLIPQDKNETLVVYTPAIPQELGELRAVREGGYKVVKRSQILGEITRGQCCLAVAGTHGKTTTSTLVAHILTSCGEGCSAFLGGISRNYGTNMLMSHNPVVVAEADEFDRSFHQLHPQIAAITAMDADHLDIYGDLEHVQQAYRIFASQVSDVLIYKLDLPLERSVTAAKMYSYHLDDCRADFRASRLRLSADGHYTYDLVTPNGVVEDIRVGTLGRLNVENSIAAAAIALCHGVAPEEVRKAIGSYMGAKRRLEEYVNSPKLTFLDDYAHHPAELAASIASIKEIFPGRKLTAIFQPHLYTRTRDFAPEFARALSLADRVVLLDIYPARELPIEGVSSEMIFKDITAPQKVLLRKEQLLEWVEQDTQADVVVTFGAGNIDRLVEPVAEILRKRI